MPSARVGSIAQGIGTCSSDGLRTDTGHLGVMLKYGIPNWRVYALTRDDAPT